VAQLAALFGQRCGFPPEIVHSLRLAGKWHDVGKSDIRYQAFLHGGSLLRATLASEIYAKSAGLIESDPEQRTAWRNSNLPDGFRHEQLSASIVNHIPGLWDGEFDPDLVLHLIASHHGRCRPMADTVIDDAPPEINLALPSVAAKISPHERSNWIPQHRLDSGVSERFWKLVHRYGWWGLAWLEAVFVLADHRQSETESERSERITARQADEVKT
jgi:CRISPR-associated endonuclease/helicase Cas3